jgi:hypothetical protein
MNADFLAYSEFPAFWEHFRPETPFGREVKEAMVFHTEPAALEALWDLTEAAAPLLEEDPVRLDRITHHLKRLPRFPREERPVYGEVDLFQFKKFLFNYRSLLQLLPAELLKRFQLAFESDLFARQLDTGRQSAESFYVADDYSQELKAVRAEIRDVDAAARAARARRLEEIQARWGLAFGTKEFALVPRAALGDPAGLLLVEPYDDLNQLVRPLKSPEELILAERRAELGAREGGLEEGVLELLSHAARQELGRLARYQEAVTAFDLALARARLAREWRLVRPVLAEGPVTIRGGRFVPCQEACRALGTAYVPLDAVFDTKATVIFGSNMGGKTIALKTLAFLQLCAQSGLFVPAGAFRTAAFGHFHYMGEGGIRRESMGLSGFGTEIRRFTEAWADFGGRTLALFDEFARTTQSREAEAILSAILEALPGKGPVVTLFSTHFRGVARFSGVRYLRMKGLDRQGLTAAGDARERIQLINRSMDFRLVEDDGLPAVSDAIAVAEILGLDPDLARRAEHHYQRT